MLYVRLPNPALPGSYVPPGAGIPPGDPISWMGHFNDLREPWLERQNERAMKIEVLGPCLLIFFASIWQTDVVNRPVPALGVGPEQFGFDGLEEEDKFWIAYSSSSRYHRIAGEIQGEMEPIEECDPAYNDRGCRVGSCR